ncbi:glycosyltransferase family 4 protein [Aquipuribacter sp. MA13-6]|uniref:glycosyltransferase family 4 protein n=1 Tax=unclassified Aquipuribacter TaxID=2635084 RepID=UPI003EE9D735
MVRDPSVPGGTGAKRVLIVVQNMNFRFDRRVQNEAHALVAADIGVTVICPKGSTTDPDVLDVDGVIVRSYPMLSPTSGVISYFREFLVAWFQAARLSWRTHREEGFDVMQACNPPDTYWALARLWRLWGKKFVYDQHDLCPEIFGDRFPASSARNRVLHRIQLWLERASYATAEQVVVPNESYREMAITRGGVPRERTTVVMSTPDHRILRRGEPQPDAREGKSFLVAYVGVMGPQDGVDRLLRAAKLLQEAGRNDIRFVLMGFGDCFENLQALSADLGLDECVHFTGRVDQTQLRSWLSAADLGVTPDPRTPFTDRSTMNKTLEYMACELAVVASDLVESRRSAGTAAVFVEDEQRLATAIAELLDDPDRRAVMGRLGRERIETELSWELSAVRYVATMSAVLGLDVLTGTSLLPVQTRRPGARARYLRLSGAS